MSPQAYVARVVDAFYARAVTDVLIGYHFRHIQDFGAHLPRIHAFWESQLLGRTSLPLSPPLDLFGVHAPLKIHRGEVGRWVKLFREILQAETPAEFQGLRERWDAKLSHFQEAFLRSPLLFPGA